MMVLNAPRRYGQHNEHARNVTMYLSCCIKGIESDRAEMFGRLFSLMKKQHTLAYFSVLRLHKVQAMMNLRQVLEAGASAAFAIANPERHGFVEVDDSGIVDPSQKLTKERYKWLKEKYQKNSDYIENKKRQINQDIAHANVITGNLTFQMTHNHNAVSTHFFDVEKELLIKSDLIPMLIDYDLCAHLRNPMEEMISGRSTSLFQAWQQCSTMSS